MARTRLSARTVSTWTRDGWCVMEGLIPPSDLADAQDALRLLFPTAPEMDSGVDDARTAPWRTWDAAWPEFPFKSSRLNRLVVHDALIDAATELLGTDDVRLYLALASAKYCGQSSGYNQLLHADYPNHSLVVPRRDQGYGHLETFVYLNDVSSRNGATRLVSRTKTAGIPVEQHTLNLDDYGQLYDDPGEAVAPAGSVVAYGPTSTTARST